ncbi:hypothetical protein J4E81_009710 [Alternaria sp. BMP 2799]|nr:hypothetical protein J4E81_009710 [Alternaria sp. BMP 2799]
MMLITTGVLLFFSLIAVSLRLYCRAILVRCVGLDDYFMLVALIVAIGLGIMNGFQVSYGTGRQSKDLNFDHFLIPTLKHCEEQAFECGTKPSRAWSAKFPEGCNDMPRTYFAMASVNILTDIVILIMPFKVFKQLNMHPRKRSSIMRLYALYVFAVSKDIPYDDIFILLLSQIEVNVAMISASAPAYRPLFNKVFSSSSSSPYVRPASDYPTVGSGRPAYNRRRKASRDQMELFSVLSTGKRASKTHARNTSEESILGEEGIRKTIDVRVIEEEEKERQNGEDRNDPAYWRGA